MSKRRRESLDSDGSGSHTPRYNLVDEVIELRALVNTLVSDKRQSNTMQMMNRSTVIPKFFPEKGEITTSRWINLIEQLSAINGWDEKAKIFHMQEKLDGLAKNWFSTLVNFKRTWEEWKNDLLEAFPEAYDFDTLNRQMVNRKKKPDESITQYFYDKNNMLRRLEIVGRNAVSSIIGGLDCASQRDGARAGHYLTPEQLFSNYLANLESVPNSKKVFNERKTQVSTNGKQDEKLLKFKCYNCREKGHLSNACTKPKKLCSTCHKLGHVSSECRKKNASNETLQMEKTLTVDNENHKYLVKVVFGSNVETGLLDSGSSINLITEATVKRLGLNITPKITKICGFAGGVYQSTQVVIAKVKVDDVESTSEFVVTPDDLQKYALIIGRPFLELSEAVVISTNENIRVLPKSMVEILEIPADHSEKVIMRAEEDMVLEPDSFSQYCLSNDPNKPCYIMTFREITIMLDCGLAAQTIFHFLPLPIVPSKRLLNLPKWMPRDESDIQLEEELKECCGRVFVDSLPEFSSPLEKLVDFSQIDVILISNYLCMLALPFVTERTGFQGKVYCTEPTMQIGKLFLEELVDYIEQHPKANVATQWKNIQHLLPTSLADASKPKTWKHIFDISDVNSSLSKIQIVGYNEKIDLYGALKAIPVSSGFCLGSSNWIMSSDYEKISYISGSSTLTTHPKPMDQQALKNSDIIIMTGLTQTPAANPDSMLGMLCMVVMMTLHAGGNVLIPCYPSGVIYDLFECLSSRLDNSGLSTVPMFFISPVADTSLAYSNILAEWLSSGKQSKVYLPEEPFPHAFLVRNSRLKHYKYIHSENFSSEFKQPCIIFCGHPSLRFGAAVHFVELWGSNPLNTIVFTEPDFPHIDALAPFQPLAMKTAHCPIDTSLNFAQANKLIKDLKPAALVIPECYVHPPLTASHRTDLIIDPLSSDKKTYLIKRGEVVTLPIKRKFVKVLLSPEIARNATPVEVRPGTSFATVTGMLKVKDNVYTISSLNEIKKDSKSKSEVVFDREDNLTITDEEYNGRSKHADEINRNNKSDDNDLEKFEIPDSFVKKFANIEIPTKETILNTVQYEYGFLSVLELVNKLNNDGQLNPKIHSEPSKITIYLIGTEARIELEERRTEVHCDDVILLQKIRRILLGCLSTF